MRSRRSPIEVEHKEVEQRSLADHSVRGASAIGYGRCRWFSGDRHCLSLHLHSDQASMGTRLINDATTFDPDGLALHHNG